jgi:predicted transposase/invertase (TIGR01784 family)
LKQAYQIAILANKRFFQDETPLHTFEYYDPLNKVSLEGRSRIITLELSKLGKIVKKPIKDMDAPELWGVYFQYLLDKSKRGIINEIIAQEEGIAMASEVLITVSKDEIERFRLLSEEKYLLDTQDDLSYAREEGREEGRQEGRTDIVRNALAEGATVEFVQKITGFDMETIKNIQAGL